MKPAVVQHADSSMLNISGEGIESEIEKKEEESAAEILHPPRLALITDT